MISRWIYLVSLTSLCLASCVSASVMYTGGRPFPVGDSIVRAEGPIAFVDTTQYVTGSLIDLFRPTPSIKKAGDTGIVIAAAVSLGKNKIITDLLMKQSRLLLLSGSMLIDDWETAIRFEMRYKVPGKGMVNSAYYAKQELVAKQLGTDIVLNPVLKSDLSMKQRLPFILTEGTWNGKHVRVFCAHDYKMTEKSGFFGCSFIDLMQLLRVEGQTRDGWSAFLSNDQLFQVLDDENRVLGEVDSESYRVFDSVGNNEVRSMVAALGAIQTMRWFSMFVKAYRFGWGPEGTSTMSSTGHNSRDLPD